MKILFTISCLSYGGAEKNLVLIADYLSKQHKVIIADFNEHETRQKINEQVKVYHNEQPNNLNSRVDWLKLRIHQYRYLKNICIKEKPDVIVSFLPIPNALAVLCGKKCHIPVIISERADPYQSSSKIDRLLHAIYNKADGAVFQTDGAKAFYSQKLQKKSVVIPNPVFNREKTIEHNYENVRKEIVSVGRFECVQKRQDLLIKAMKVVLDQHPDYQLRFWGDGQDESKIRELAIEEGISDNVIFSGLTNQALDKINESEIFVLTSDYEGIPNVLIEAMSIGMPCVSTDCSPGGARLLIENGINGLLVERGDIKAIADSIIYFIEHRDKEKEYGRRALSINNRFTYDIIMNKWENYLSSFKGGTQ